MTTIEIPHAANARTERSIDVCQIMGLPLARLTFERTLDHVDHLIASGKPGYFITANLHYAMLTSREQRLREINRDAAFIVADGMPLVWASRRSQAPLPERVAGSDLVPALCRRSAERGHRVFFLGAGPEIALQAAERMKAACPGINIVGVEAPEPADFVGQRNDLLIDRIRSTSPQLLFVALGQPKGEIWIHDNYQRLGSALCVQIGATFDFMAGHIERAPRWMQRTGLEWTYRISRKPGRMIPRYAADASFLLRRCASSLFPRPSRLR